MTEEEIISFSKIRQQGFSQYWLRWFELYSALFDILNIIEKIIEIKKAENER